jgi:hypothetical protein
VDSIDTIERLANTEQPPLKVRDITALIDKLSAKTEDEATIKDKLSGMATVFQGRASLSTWNPDILDKIDECFVNSFYDAGTPCSSLFFPKSANYMNRFTGYCGAVDRVFLSNPNTSPPYAREYFAYAMIWQLHGHRFPMPLGTASAVEAVNFLATKYHRGLSEVTISLLSFLTVSHRSGCQTCRVWDTHPTHGRMRGVICATHRIYIPCAAEEQHQMHRTCHLYPMRGRMRGIRCATCGIRIPRAAE